MNARTLLLMTAATWLLSTTAGNAELHVVQPNGVTVVRGYKIPHGETTPDLAIQNPAPAAIFDIAELLSQPATVFQKCQNPEEGDTGPFPGVALKLNRLYVPIRGRANWLPPDPGNAGKATIEGIDSDRDCVRDDIENYIARKYPKREQQKLRKHLFKLARYLGLFLQPDLSREDAAYYSANMFVATECAHRELGQVPTAAKDLDMIFAKFHNTLDRSYRYIENSAKLGGTSTKIADEIYCDFPEIPIISKEDSQSK